MLVLSIIGLSTFSKNNFGSEQIELSKLYFFAFSYKLKGLPKSNCFGREKYVT